MEHADGYGCDWLRATGPAESFGFARGFLDESGLIACKRFGYRGWRDPWGCFVGYDEGQRRPVLLDLSGAAVERARSLRGTDGAILASLQPEELRVCRLDVARDHHGAMTTAALWAAQADRRYVARWVGRPGSAGPFEPEGWSAAGAPATLYCGSRKGECFGRVYDKALQVLQQGGDPGELPWCRWEMQLANDAARAVAAVVVASGSAAAWASVWSWQVRLTSKRVDPDERHQDRAGPSPEWAAFVAGATGPRPSLRTVDSVEKRAEGYAKWVVATMPRALAAVERSATASAVLDLAAKGRERPVRGRSAIGASPEGQVALAAALRGVGRSNATVVDCPPCRIDVTPGVLAERSDGGAVGPVSPTNGPREPSGEADRKRAAEPPQRRVSAAGEPGRPEEKKTRAAKPQPLRGSLARGVGRDRWDASPAADRPPSSNTGATLANPSLRRAPKLPSAKRRGKPFADGLLRFSGDRPENCLTRP